MTKHRPNEHAKGFDGAGVERALRAGDFIGATVAMHSGIGGKVGRRDQARRVTDKIVRSHDGLPLPVMREIVVTPVPDAGQPEESFVALIPIPDRDIPA